MAWRPCASAPARASPPSSRPSAGERSPFLCSYRRPVHQGVELVGIYEPALVQEFAHHRDVTGVDLVLGAVFPEWKDRLRLFVFVHPVRPAHVSFREAQVFEDVAKPPERDGIIYGKTPSLWPEQEHRLSSLRIA